MIRANRATLALIALGVLALNQGSDAACLAYIALVVLVIVWAQVILWRHRRRRNEQ